MYSRQTILTQLQPFQNKKDILVHDQGVGDIISGILLTHDQYKKQYDKIVPFFIGATPEITSKNVWKFVKENVKYKVEPEHEQLLKSPAAIITPYVDGKVNTSDCKNMSLFIGGVLDAAARKGQRINWCYRFSSYKFLDKIPQHVFCVINPDTNNEIWADAVLPSFNNRKQYYYKTDKKVNNMALVSLAGTKKKKKKSAPATTKAEKKKKRQEFFKKLKAKTKKAGKLILKYNPATVISRNAFLKLVQLNVRSLATNLQRIINAGDQEAFKIWGKVGGNVDSLKKAIQVGAKKKRLGAAPMRHIRRTVRVVNPMQSTVTQTFVPVPAQPAFPTSSMLPDSNIPEDEFFETEEAEEVEVEENIIGVVDPATGTAAAIAAAAPIVALILPLLRRNKNKLSKGNDSETLLSDVNADVAKESQDVADSIEKEAAGIETDKGNQIIKGGTTVPAAAGGKLPILPIAAGVVALYFITKKK
jgi:hypothetical protein